MLQFENVSTFYGKIQALHDVNVEVRQGEIVTLIGANGAGKSTLLMTLCGSPQAHSGSIRYMGEELVGQHSAAIMRSEEHTSELQSLMRISYAVFCLKKKNTTQL